MSIGKLVPGFIRSKYSRRLLVLLSIVVLVIAIIGGVAYTKTGEALEENTETNHEQGAEMQAHALEEWIRGTENHVETLSTTVEIGSNDTDQVEKRLRDNRESMTDSVVALHYVDSEFEIQASSADVAGSNLQAENVEWTEEAVPDTGETVRHGPYSDPVVGGGQKLAIASGIPDNDGFLVAVIDLETQTEALESRLGDDAFTVVLDSEATVMMSHHTEQIGESDKGHDDKHLEIVERALEGETGYVRMEMMDGHDQDNSDHADHGDQEEHESTGGNAHHGDLAMGYAPIEGTDWAVMIHTPADDAFALRDQIGQLMLALLAISFVGLGTVGLVVGRNTSQSLAQLASKAQELEQGNLETELQASRDDELGQLYDAFANMRDSLQESFRETEAARAEAEQQRQQLETFARQLEEEAGEVMVRAANGDLTGRIEVVGESEELKQVAHEYNEMIDEIERTAAHLKQFAATVTEHSEEVTASAEEVQGASESVTRSVQTISVRTTEQEDKLQAVSENMHEISTTTEEIASLSQEVSTVADQTERAGKQGRTAAQEAIAAMDDVDQASQKTVAVIEELEEEIVQAEEIAGIIADIAKQMNMLALNASIEASRSDGGDDGGFGAVAEQVKELSKESQESAEDIAEMADGILGQMQQVTEEIKNTRAEITASQETVHRTAEAHEDIADYAERTSEGVSEISAATQQQAASTQEIVATIEEIAELSSDVANEAGEVAAAAEEQTSALSEVTGNAKNLTTEANDLQKELDQFTISSDIEASSPPGLPETGEISNQGVNTKKEDSNSDQWSVTKKNSPSRSNE